MTRRSFTLLVGLPKLFKSRHKPVVFEDAAMIPETGMLVVAVPVEFQAGTRVWLNGKELRKDIDFRVTQGGLFPLPGPYMVEWKAHRSRHKVTF